MNATCADSASTQTLAFSQATGNFAENRAAIARTQPAFQIGDLPHDVEWIFARDRALTFRDLQGKWFTGCSLPRRAAAEMMRRLDLVGPVSCFLAPSHAAQLRVALDRLRPEQSIIAVVPDADSLAPLLACNSFAADIDAHRLWFVAGEGWVQSLKQLFADVPGLCTPAQFIRLPLLEEGVFEQLVPAAQKVFSEVQTDRAEKLRTARESYRIGSTRLCVVGGSQFRLWDDAGAALADLLHSSNHLRLNLDDPAQASALALAKQSADCGAVVTANIGRSDLPGVLSDAQPVITWASDTRTPSGAGARNFDRIITAYPLLAQRAGWRTNQIIQATWPIPARRDLAARSAKTQTLAIVADTRPVEVPADLSEYSSHRVLWELIVADLHNAPFTLTDDIEGFLTHRMRKLDIAAESLSTARFVLELILPAYQQSLARLLLRNKIPLALFGKGWDLLPEFAALASGIVSSRERLHRIAGDHAALVHVWTNAGPHPMDALGAPVLRRRGNIDSTFVSDARQLLTGRAVSAPNSVPQLTADTILKLVR